MMGKTLRWIREHLNLSSPEKQRHRVNHLEDLMYMATRFQWSSFLNYHTSILVEIERGNSNWGDSFEFLKDTHWWENPHCSRDSLAIFFPEARNRDTFFFGDLGMWGTHAPDQSLGVVTINKIDFIEILISSFLWAVFAYQNDLSKSESQAKRNRETIFLLPHFQLNSHSYS